MVVIMSRRLHAGGGYPGSAAVTALLGELHLGLQIVPAFTEWPQLPNLPACLSRHFSTAMDISRPSSQHIVGGRVIELQRPDARIRRLASAKGPIGAPPCVTAAPCHHWPVQAQMAEERDLTAKVFAAASQTTVHYACVGP